MSKRRSSRQRAAASFTPAGACDLCGEQLDAESTEFVVSEHGGVPGWIKAEPGTHLLAHGQCGLDAGLLPA